MGGENGTDGDAGGLPLLPSSLADKDGEPAGIRGNRIT
jgi:hypothetical protein